MKRPEVKVESAAESLAKVALFLALFVSVVYMSNTYKTSCGNDWMYAILKSFGIVCLSTVVLSAVTWPLDYWNRTQAQRGTTSVAGKISNFIDPRNVAGQAIVLLLTLALFMVFTRDCGVQTSSLDFTTSPMDTMNTNETTSF